MSAAHRLYLDAPETLHFEASVTDIRELSRANGLPLFQIALDRSAFYPTGGGQPHDLGHLQAVARSGVRLDVPILNVEEDDTAEVWHTVAKPLAAGTRVTGYVDPARRLDHSQQHTGQHLLSAILLRELDAPTLSFHLGAEVSTIDLDRDALPPTDLDHIETSVNHAIAANLPVRIHTVDRPAAEAMLAAGRLRKLPPRPGPLRLIEIDTVEHNACGGTHVRSTGQIGGLTLRRAERVRNPIDRTRPALRLEFCCGLRAIRSARADFDLLTESARILSASPIHIPAKLTHLLDSQKSAAKLHHALLEDLAAAEAAHLVARARISSSILIEPSPTTRDLPYAKLLAAKITTLAPEAVVLVTIADPVRSTLILARGPSAAQDCAAILRSALSPLNARGGGSPELAQGAVPTPLLEQVAATIRSLARS